MEHCAPSVVKGKVAPINSSEMYVFLKKKLEGSKPRIAESKYRAEDHNGTGDHLHINMNPYKY